MVVFSVRPMFFCPMFLGPMFSGPAPCAGNSPGPRPVRRRGRRAAPERCASRSQRGVVLPLVLVLLLLTTIVGYQVMETSALEARMAVAREGKELSFQAAEAAIEQARNSEAGLRDAFAAARSAPGDSAWPVHNYSFGEDLSGRVEFRYIGEIPALGSDLVIGNPGLRSLHFELRASTSRSDERFDSEHIQGIKRFAPRPL